MISLCAGLAAFSAIPRRVVSWKCVILCQYSSRAFLNHSYFGPPHLLFFLSMLERVALLKVTVWAGVPSCIVSSLTSS